MLRAVPARLFETLKRILYLAALIRLQLFAVFAQIQLKCHGFIVTHMVEPEGQRNFTLRRRV